MKIKIFFTAIIVLITITVYSQVKPFNNSVKLSRVKLFVTESTTYLKYSPYSRVFLSEIRNRKLKSDYFYENLKLRDEFSLKKINNSTYLGALLKVMPCMIKEELEVKGVLVGSIINDIWSVKIPIEILEDIQDFECIEFIQIDEPITTKLDKAREATWVDWVNVGYDLPKGYCGEDVIIGVLDFGFDLTHPTFYDTAGLYLRIISVWNTVDESGNPPSGFMYGSEYFGEQSIINKLFTDSTGSHGTHVAGIAAGSGIATDGEFVGVATGSNLILVQLDGGQSDITDGINYIFNYANSVNKPAVINMSLGTHIGPHDGTSLQDQVFDNISGHGRILVGSAGNEGDTPLHASHTFLNDTVQTLVYFEESQSNTGDGSLDLWGEPNSDFTLTINVFDDEGYYIAWVPYYNTNEQIELDTIFLINNDTISVELYSESSNFTNDRPRFFVYIDNPIIDHFVSIELTASNNTIHIWNHGKGKGAPLTNEFPGYGIIPGWIAGDNSYTVGEIGGTAKEIITVGAFTTKNSYLNYYGVLQTASWFTDNGEIAPFSSHGPTLDGRTKPEITAPGNVVISSVNSFNSEYLPENSDEVVSGVTDGTDNWYFAAMQGTSMATPMVAGIIALWLEANPNLTPSQIKELLKSTSWQDVYTDAIPLYGSNTWGWGKIDAHEGIKEVLNKLPSKPGIGIVGETTFCEGESATLTGPAGYDKYLWSNNDTTQNIVVKQYGYYSLQVIDNNGWYSPQSDSLEIIVYPKPTKPSVNFNDNTLSTDAIGTIQWYDMNGSIIGATSSTYNPSYDGKYYIRVENEFGCVNNADTVDIKLVGTSKTTDLSLIIYPNPAIDKLIIEGNLFNHTDILVELFNNLNQRVYQKKYYSSQDIIHTIDLSNFKQGIYIIRLKIDNQVLSKKIVIL